MPTAGAWRIACAWKRRWRAMAMGAAVLASLAGVAEPAGAAVSVLRPPREATTRAPLEIRVMYGADGAQPLDVDIPSTVTVTLTNGDTAPIPVVLQRATSDPDHVLLAPGTFRTVVFAAPWPDWARGTMKLDVPGMDVSPSLVVLTRERGGWDGEGAPVAGTAGAAGVADGTGIAGAAGAAAGAPDTTVQARRDLPRTDELPFINRFSAFEPVYFADGSNGANLARFQLSFKYRVMIPDDPRSLGFLDNLYLGYTQTSIWDIREESAPFRDTSYMPQFFYFVPDTGWKGGPVTRTGVMAGLGHESNGRDGPESRGVDIAFVRPSFDFGDLTRYHLTVAPKAYYYLIKHDNSDIADYRGYVDLLVKYGSPDGFQAAAMLRKGMKSWYGSIDTQFTYPLGKLINPSWGGYLWVGYFNGYGEDILDYNKKRWIARIGLSLIRW